MHNYGSVTLDADCLTVRDQDGSEIRLTRLERLLLRYLALNPGRLLSRNQLLDAISEPGSEKNDRTIDFIVNRLRAKLNDDAKRPRYIATRYGDGYVWIARPQEQTRYAEPAWLILGPVRKLGGFDATRAVEHFVQRLQRDLSERFGNGRRIAIDPDWTANGSQPSDLPEYVIDLTFVPLGADSIDCVLAIRHQATGRLIRTHRAGMVPTISSTGLSELVADAIWKDLLYDAGHHQPLAVRLSAANIALTGDPRDWTENDRRLRALLARSPGDPVLRLFHATNLEARCVIEGPGYFLGPNDPAADLAEVEATLVEILPQLQDDLVHGMNMARLLFILGQAYHPMALALAERAHREGTTLAESYGTMGFIRACLGDIDAGIDAYDIALGMTKPGSQYDLYLLVLKAQAQLAGDLRDDLARTLSTAYSRSPALAPFMEPLCSPRDAPSAVAVQALDSMQPAMATAMLRYLFWSCTRNFVLPHHRRNTMEPAARLMTRRFGRQVMPADLLAEFGGLLD